MPKKFKNTATAQPKNFLTKFRSELWKWQAAKAAWFFVRVPHEESLQIKYRNLLCTRGWGSIPVEVTIGKTSWRTSVFPESKTGCYILPVKLEVRKKENLKEGNLVEVTIASD